ncbi:AAA family ATPase [Bremerella sp. JC770]|uniref:AAA family ATPase n=1 Tax=Bremerella sp. JC770 TaxID=3232137 RepID=UPI0034599F0E
MTLKQRLGEYVRACFTGLWIESHEHQDALVSIAQLCRQENWQLATWDLESGLRSPMSETNASAGDPLGAIRGISNLAMPNGTTLVVLQNFHRFMQSAEIVQALAKQVIAGKQDRTFVVILSPVVSLPAELEKLFVVLEHELPDREQLREIATGIATEEGELPEGQDREILLDAAVGLTRFEAEGAFSLSLVRDGRLTATTLWEQKAQMLKKSGLLNLYRGGDDFSRLGGLAALKAFTKRALLQPRRNNPLKRPRGVMLLSPPGCGKSQFCKSLGSEVGRPVLILDVGSLLGSLVGQSEERTRAALRTVDAMAPCILMIDEVEKAFSGLGGNSDSGVSARMFGTFLSWLNDHESDVFVVCTANDVSKLPPEFSRSERFDGVFFVDLPGREEKDAIWEIYRTLFEIAPDQRRPKDDDFTGAEIRACCRLAALLDVSLTQAAQYIVPVAVTSAESVTRLRQWASGRCLSASNSGIYRCESSSAKARRRVSRDPSSN